MYIYTGQRKFLAINRFTFYTYCIVLSCTGNVIKLSAKTIIYPDPAVPRNEGKWVEVINTALRESNRRVRFGDRVCYGCWIKGKDLWRVGNRNTAGRKIDLFCLFLSFFFFFLIFSQCPASILLSRLCTGKNRPGGQSYQIRIGASNDCHSYRLFSCSLWGIIYLSLFNNNKFSWLKGSLISLNSDGSRCQYN